MSHEPYVILVGTDYSEHAARALRAAYEQALRHRPAELHVVHASLAISPEAGMPLPPFATLGLPVQTLDDQQSMLVKHLDADIAKLPGFRDAGVKVIAHVQLDAPAFAVTRLATEIEADLIVVGTHGRHGMARWLLGSVAEAVVRQATCPVLVVPPEHHELPVPEIEPPCPRCVAARQESAGAVQWCSQHRERHGRRHTYHQGDRAGSETNMPLVVK